ncbi:MAG: DUF983 domain-containing protein [Proteobacteria bacterium]|nr:DUF983 domain-containing protein [Pseudomonadota bacterium]
MAEEPLVPFLWRAVSCRCPRCGKGKLFADSLKFTERCSHCSLAIAKHDNGDGPAVFLIFILGFLLVPLALTFARYVEWPLWAYALLWGPVILGATLGMLRPAKALTLALQYRHRREVFDES